MQLSTTTPEFPRLPRHNTREYAKKTYRVKDQRVFTFFPPATFETLLCARDARNASQPFLRRESPANCFTEMYKYLWRRSFSSAETKTSHNGVCKGVHNTARYTSANSRRPERRLNQRPFPSSLSAPFRVKLSSYRHAICYFERGSTRGRRQLIDRYRRNSAVFRTRGDNASLSIYLTE